MTRFTGGIELHIEELVLHGFAPGDRHRIAGALELELTRLLTEQGLPAALQGGGELERLDGGVITVRPGGRPEELGAQVARSVYGRSEVGE